LLAVVMSVERKNCEKVNNLMRTVKH